MIRVDGLLVGVVKALCLQLNANKRSIKRKEERERSESEVIVGEVK